MAERPPSMILVALGALGGAAALGALFVGLSDGPEPPPRSPPDHVTAADASTAPPPPDEREPEAFRLTMSPLPYVGEIRILEEALADGREDFEACWRRADGADGTYRIRVRLDSGPDTASAGEVEVVPHPGVEPFVCMSSMLEPRPGHDSFFDGGFTLTIVDG